MNEWLFLLILTTALNHPHVKIKKHSVKSIELPKVTEGANKE